MSAKSGYVVYNGSIPDKFAWMNCTSLGEVFLRRLDELGDNVLLIDGLTSKKFTASQIRSHSIRLALCLRHFSIKTGDTISIHSENRIEIIYLLLATIYLGATLGLTFVDNTDEEYKNTIALLRPRIIFSSETVLNKILKLSRTYNVEKVVVFGDSTDYYDAIGYNEFFNDSEIETNANFWPDSVNMWDSVAAIIRTSGTTSSPKCVQLTQMNLLCSILEYKKWRITPEPLVLSCLPWLRPFGLRLLIRQIMHNVKMIFLPKFNENEFLKAIETYRPNTINLYVTTLDFLAKSSLTSDYDLSSIKVLFSCSAALDNRLKNSVFTKFGIPIIQQGYGMSELSSIADQDDTFHKEGSVGILRKGIYGKVIDIVTGNVLGPNEKGHLLFKGPNVMKGYLHNDVATKCTIDKDGWLHTGDYGYFDKNNELFLVDRLKDLIRFKDHLILPAEIECVLRECPQIEDAGVIGINSNDSGEVPFAFIVKSDAQISPQEIMDLVVAKLPPEKHISGIMFTEKIPGDGSGKPSRLLLRQIARDRGINV